MLADIPYEEWADAFEATAEELLWEAGIADPPVDAFLFAMRLGLLVTENDALPVRAQFARLAGEPTSVAQSGVAQAGETGLPRGTSVIVLGEEERFERRQFAVAHELGEFSAARVFNRLGIEPHHAPIGSREQVANAIAGRLLLPWRWFREQGLACDWDLRELKKVFTTASHELIARRMLDMPDRIVLTLFDQGHVTWRRSNTGTRSQPICDQELQCWRECHDLGLATYGEIVGEEFSTIPLRCWPVHEPEWKREILRMDMPIWE